MSDEGGLIMDAETTDAFNRVYEKIDALKCVERGIELAKIQQKIENGEKVEELKHKKKIEGLTFYRVLIAVGLFGLAIIQILDHFFWN